MWAFDNQTFANKLKHTHTHTASAVHAAQDLNGTVGKQTVLIMEDEEVPLALSLEGEQDTRKLVDVEDDWQLLHTCTVLNLCRC